MSRQDAAPSDGALGAGPVELTAREAAVFADRVMAAIAVAPPPTPTRSLLAALRAGATRDAAAALWVAWHLGTVRSWYVAPRVRARSFALVLAAVSVLATGSLAAAAAVHVVVPQITPTPVTDPGGSRVDRYGPVVNQETPGPELRRTDDATQSPDPVDESGGTDDGDVDSVGGDGSGEPDADEDGSDGTDESDESHADADGGSNGSNGADESDDTTDHGGSSGADESDESHADEDSGSSGADESDDTTDHGGSSGADESHDAGDGSGD